MAGSSNGQKKRRKKRQSGPDFVTVRAQRVSVTMLVVLVFNDENGAVEFCAEEAPNGRDETVVDPQGGFAFYFADRKELHVFEEGSDKPVVYGSDDLVNDGPLIYRPECKFGSAAELLAEFPGDVELAEFVGQERGKRLIMIPEPYAPSGVTRHYRRFEEGNRIQVRQNSAADEAAPELTMTKARTGAGLGGYQN